MSHMASSIKCRPIFNIFKLKGEKGFKPVKKLEIKAMFNHIAGHYDLLNHLLSFGIDIYWRKRLIKLASEHKPKKIIDIATGTADLAIMASKIFPESIVGIDLASDMLSIGKEKVQKKGLNHLIELQEQDAEALRFADKTFDLGMVAFGVRNFANLEKGLKEICRVIKIGRPLLVLEFSTPQSKIFRGLYRFYSFTFLPFVGRLISKNIEAYTYLPKSIINFPDGERFIMIMEQAGFHQCSMKKMTLGIVTLYLGYRKE